MKSRFFFALGVALPFAVPLAAWAHLNPDFNEDAKPILRKEPHLLSYVRHHFEVKDTGTARFPGDAKHAPKPPFVFLARPLGTTGPFYLTLLIRPGAPGRILKVVNNAPSYKDFPPLNVKPPNTPTPTLVLSAQSTAVPKVPAPRPNTPPTNSPPAP